MSLFLSRTSGDVIAEIKMNMTSFAGGYLLVEGPSDSRFFSSRISKSECQIVICGAKNTVIQVSSVVTAQTGSKTVGIIDDDLDSLLNVNHMISDLIPTDTHDIETLMLSSSAFDRLIDEAADSAKIELMKGVEQKPLIELLLDRARPFAKLRYLNTLHKLNISFEDHFSPWKFIDHTTWQLDSKNLFLQFSQHAGWTLANLQAAYDAVPAFPDWNLCHGHDTISILAIAFNEKIRHGRSLTSDDICRALRLSYDAATFLQTSLCQRIKAWESSRLQRILS